MTVKELHKELSDLIEQGHSDTIVIANCSFTLRGEMGDSIHHEIYLTELNDVYYQSGDIELGFSQKE